MQTAKTVAFEFAAECLGAIAVTTLGRVAEAGGIELAVGLGDANLGVIEFDGSEEVCHDLILCCLPFGGVGVVPR